MMLPMTSVRLFTLSVMNCWLLKKLIDGVINIREEVVNSLIDEFIPPSESGRAVGYQRVWNSESVLSSMNPCLFRNGWMKKMRLDEDGLRHSYS